MKFIEEKVLDTQLGLLSDAVLNDVLGEYPVKQPWKVLPFLNINGTAVAINRRSETARKALVWHVGGLAFLKEVPWYCASRNIIRYAHQAQNQLRQRGLPIPHIHSTRGGSSFTVRVDAQGKEQFYVLHEHVAGHSWNNSAEQLQGAACTLADFHNAAAQVPLMVFTETPRSNIFHLARTMLNVFENLYSGNTHPGVKTYCDAARGTIEQAVELAAQRGYFEESCCVHGDYNPWNVLFQDSGTVAAVLDFDNAIHDHPIHDLAEALLNYCFMQFKPHKMRYQGSHLNWDHHAAWRFYTAYWSKREGVLESQYRPLLLPAVQTVATELITLGLVRGDYELQQVPELLESLERLERQLRHMMEETA